MQEAEIIKKYFLLEKGKMHSILGQKLLQMRDVTVVFSTDSSTFRAVDNVSLTINAGEIYGLVGESGSGKTMTALSIMRLIPLPGIITSGKIMFEGDDLIKASQIHMESIRGKKISIIFQEPMTSLNPVFRVGDQVAEVLSIHTDHTKNEIKEKVIELLESVGLEEPQQKYLQYPHQLSGGQRQRILIAISIACKPLLVIADEPTTALDVSTEGQILYLLENLVHHYKMSMLFITHNLNVVKRLGTKIGIMYAGRILEENTVNDFFIKPLHPYSVGLLKSVVWLKNSDQKLSAIPGSVPKLSDLPKGCKFHPRCVHVMPKCTATEPPFINIGENKWVRCYLYQN